MNIKHKYIPKGTKARPAYSMQPKYITIHNTANTSKGADAANHAKYMCGSGSNSYVSYHYVVDDAKIYQLIPDNEAAWHAGDGATGKGNRQSLAIEICENSDGDLLKATNLAAELTALLMTEHNISLDKVVQHNYWSGKNCPNRIRKGEPYNWNTFLKKVQGYLGGEPEIEPYKVKVICKSLNIRKTPKWGAKDVVGVIKNGGIYTIVDECMLGSTKFGKLKSGAGWISLGSAYIKKV